MLIKFNKNELYDNEKYEFEGDKVYDLKDQFAMRWIVRDKAVEVDPEEYSGEILADPRSEVTKPTPKNKESGEVNEEKKPKRKTRKKKTKQ